MFEWQNFRIGKVRITETRIIEVTCLEIVVGSRDLKVVFELAKF